MKGKAIKRITAGIMALSMAGMTLPANLGHIALFDGIPITASAADYEVSTWAELQAAVANDGAGIKLTANIDAGANDDRIFIQGNKTIIIDLDGHTLNRNRTTAHADGHVIQVEAGSTLTVTNGTLTGGYANNGGGIYNEGTLNVKGKVIMKDNTKQTSANNLYLTAGKVITLKGALDPESRIRVYGESINTPLTSSWGTYMGDSTEPGVILTNNETLPLEKQISRRVLPVAG